MKRGTVSILGFSALLALVGCQHPRERHVVVREQPVVRERVRAPIVVTQPPPPPVEEAIPPAPGPRYVWAPGYWIWNGRWLWQSGRWTLPPRERAVWQPGHWVERRGDWVWEPGHWR